MGRSPAHFEIAKMKTVHLLSTGYRAEGDI
jgi:hypothetical protein